MRAGRLSRKTEPGVDRPSRVTGTRLAALRWLVGASRFTTAASILLETQRQGETAAWIEYENGALYPPDLADSGIDLEGLVVVRIPRSFGVQALLKAAEFLLRSGGFGLVLMNFSETHPPRQIAWQGRLLGLARQHHTQVVFITDASRESLSSLVGIRIEPRRARSTGGAFAVVPHVRKDKAQSLGDMPDDVRRGPAGLQVSGSQ